mgnify:FL=1
MPERTRSDLRDLLFALLESTRPRQWIKNLLIFAALLFAKKLTDPVRLAHALLAFVLFCAVSGGVYLFNDMLDREKDRLHPIKARRPLASGRLPMNVALPATLVLLTAAVASSPT